MKIIITILILSACSLAAFAQTDQVDNPIQNFEKLWSTFNERYANFEIKKVDWMEIHKRYRSQISKKTTNAELFEVSCAMVQELNDGHVTIVPDFDNSDIECGPPYTFVFDELIQSQEDAELFKQAMESTFAANGFGNKININVTEETNFHYRISNDIGYLRIDEMTEKLNLKPLGRALDQALEAFQNKSGVIIDLRFNGGGWDYAAYKIANRFVNKKKLGHLKKKRIKGTDKFCKLKSRYLKPKGHHQFTKPIIILTSDFTASAAEVFLLALKDLPYVTIVGDTTEGIFSDMYEFKLSNGWEVSLSHMQFFDADMVNYEAVGIEPDHLVVNSRADMEQMRDGVIEKAIKVLKLNFRKSN